MSKKTLLVVDDDLNIALLLSNRFKEDGFEVIVATDASQGELSAQTNKVDIILLDVMMRGTTNGFDLCRTLRGIEATRYTPIIMVTSMASEMDKIVGLEIGADDYVVKPVPLEELVARVRALLRRHEKSEGRLRAGEDIHEGNLVLSPRTRIVTKDGVVLKLTVKEFDLLAYFMNNKGMVLHRDTLLLFVWGDNTFIDPRTVDTHIRWLRLKIEREPDNPSRIVTVRGIGYRFIE